jgi:cobalt-zinc-cadmium efflux system protein
VSHDHDHHHAPANHDEAFAVGIGLNLLYVVLEAAFGVLSGSLALIADAGHNLSDVAGLLLAWGAAWLSRRHPTERRTYGYRRSSILASLANAVLLLVAVGAIALEAVRRFFEPQPVEIGTILWVAAVGVAVNAGTAVLFMSGRKGDLNIRGAFLHMAADAAVSLAVVIGAGLIAWTGRLWIDPVLSLAIAAVIVAGTAGLLRESVDMALDAVPRGIDVDEVQAWLLARPGVVEIHDLHVWSMSTTETALTAHLIRPDNADADAFLHGACEGLHARFGIGHATLQVETDGEAACRLAPAEVV